MQHLLFFCANEDMSTDYDVVPCSKLQYRDMLELLGPHLFLCERLCDVYFGGTFLLGNLFYPEVPFVHLSGVMLLSSINFRHIIFLGDSISVKTMKV